MATEISFFAKGRKTLNKGFVMVFIYFISLSFQAQCQIDTLENHYSKEFSGFLKRKGYSSVHEINTIRITESSFNDDILMNLKYLDNLHELYIQVDDAKVFHSLFTAEFGKTLADLKHLITLSFVSDNADELPDIFSFTPNQIKYFHIKLQKLKSIPESLVNLKNLRQLSIYSDSLKIIPEIFASFSLLEELLINTKRVKEIPISVTSLIKLKFLSFYGDLNKLPVLLYKMPALKILGLDIHNIKTINDSFFYGINNANNRKRQLYIYFLNAQNLEEIDFGIFNFNNRIFDDIQIDNICNLKRIKNLNCKTLNLNGINFKEQKKIMYFESGEKMKCKIDTIIIPSRSFSCIPKRMNRLSCVKSIHIPESRYNSGTENSGIYRISPFRFAIIRLLSGTRVRIIRYEE